MALALWCQSIFACLLPLTLKPYSSLPPCSPGLTNLTVLPPLTSVLFPASISHLALKLSVRAVGDTFLPRVARVTTSWVDEVCVCECAHVRTHARDAELHILSLFLV